MPLHRFEQDLDGFAIAFTSDQQGSQIDERTFGVRLELERLAQLTLGILRAVELLIGTA